mmetsp:Transcript_39073/g.112803  ORF Transcript_39073/g.112803 Transcript_39073/m.112803 type:complete len:317 (-) Transcript_39073:808-1758(-)
MLACLSCRRRPTGEGPERALGDLLPQREDNVDHVGEQEDRARPPWHGVRGAGVNQHHGQEGDGALQDGREQVVHGHGERAADEEERLDRPRDRKGQEDVLDVGAEGVGNRHRRLPLLRDAHPREHVGEGCARRRDREAKHVGGDAKVAVDPVAGLDHRVGKDGQPEHAHREGHGVQVLLLGIVHVRDRPLDEELHGELQPLDPLHEQGEARLGRRGLCGLAALRQKFRAEGLHPRAHDHLVLGAELQGDKISQVGVVLMNMEVEALVITNASLAIKDVLQRNYLPRGVTEAWLIDCGRLNNCLQLGLGNVAEQGPI